MSSFRISQSSGPARGKLPPLRSSRKARADITRTQPGLVTIAKLQLWQTVWTIMPLLFAHTVAHNNSLLADSSQTGLGQGSPPSLPLQSFTNDWQMTTQALEDHPEVQSHGGAAGRDLPTRVISAVVAGRHTRSSSGGISEAMAFTAGVQEHVSGPAPVLQKGHFKSKAVGATTSITLETLTKTTDLSLEQPEPQTIAMFIDEPVLSTEESPHRSELLTVPVGTQVEPGKDTEFPQSSVHSSEEDKGIVSPINGVSSTDSALSFSEQSSTLQISTKSTLRGTFEWPSRSAASLGISPDSTTLSSSMFPWVEQGPSTSPSALPLHLGVTKKQEDSLPTGPERPLETESPRLAWKEDALLTVVPKGKSGQVDFVSEIPHGTVSTPPLTTLHSGESEMESSLPFQPGPSEASLLKATAHTEQKKTKFVTSKQQTSPPALVLPLSSTEFPLETSVASSSEETQVFLVGEQPRAIELTPLPPLSSAFLAVSEESSETLFQTVSLVPEVTSDSPLDPFTAGNGPMFPSEPYLHTARITQQISALSTEVVGHDLLPGEPTASATVEAFDVTPHDFEHSLLTQSSVASSGSSVLLREPRASAGTIQPSHSSMETQTVDLKAVRSPPGADATYEIASHSFTKAPETDFSADSITSALDAQQVSETPSSHLHSTQSKDFSEPDVRGDLSLLESKSSQTTPLLSSPASLLTIPSAAPGRPTSAMGTTCQDVPCLSHTTPTSVAPSPNLLTPLPTASQPLSTTQVLVTMQRSTDLDENEAAGAFMLKMTTTGPKEVNTMVRATLEDSGHTSEMPEVKAPTSDHFINQFSESQRPSIIAHFSPLHNVTLQFHLIRIVYQESLANRSSESYQRLSKEIKLTLNKMLSRYEGFIQTNVLGFLNGSVIVKMVATFYSGAPIPTPSDVIRTIVTEVESKEMDTFFQWRMDVQSLSANGFSLKNLEPENLALAFTVLDLRSPATFEGGMSWDYLQRLRNEVTLLLSHRYSVQNVSLVQVGSCKSGMEISGGVFINTSVHVDIDWALKALTQLANLSVDLTSLSINESRLKLQVFPVSFLVTNRVFTKSMMDRSSVEHQSLARDISDVLMHILGKYENLLQVTIREITGSSVILHGDVIFQHPAPASRDVLRTLVLSVGPKDYLDSSGLQVDPFSFTVAGDGLEPPTKRRGVPGYGIAIIVLCALVLVLFPPLTFLPKILGQRNKVIINRWQDQEAGVETFELDNPGFRSNLPEGDGRSSYTFVKAAG